jgi:TolB-like protein
LTLEARDEAIEFGMADALIIKLSAARLVVKPLSSVRKFVNVDQDAVEPGRQLGVDAVVDGSIQRAAGRIRITVRLVAVRDGRQLWADRYDGEFADIFLMQDSISERVAHSLSLTLGSEEQVRLKRRYTESSEAYQLYLKGRYFWNKRTADGLRRGIEYFSQAVGVDPAYALAYSGMSDSYALLSGYTDSAPKESLPAARNAALLALKIDDTLSEAHTSLAFVKEAFEWDWPRAEAEYRRAIELDPDYPTAHHRYGMFLC